MQDVILQLDDFDFELPEELIALMPLAARDQSRLLHVYGSGRIEEDRFADIAGYFQAGDVLIVNNSRVIPAALSGHRLRDGFCAQVHCNLHKQVSDYEWLAFIKPFKRVRAGDLLQFGRAGDKACELGKLNGTIIEKRAAGEVLIAFDCSSPVLDERLSEIGDMPLPPYIASRRAADASDRETYQTVYARDEGSVAAPTAGLHFTQALLDKLRARGVIVEAVTLHVGAGTFLPVKGNDIHSHKMHSEWGLVDSSCIEAIKEAKGAGRQVTAVGTTSLRLLESAALGAGGLQAFEGETDIFIKPGFEFQVVDRLITNFHLPRSTLFMLVAAFTGLEEMKAAYAHAIDAGFRFYSYGDACFLERKA